MIQNTSNAFKIILPNVNASNVAEEDAQPYSEAGRNIDELKILEFAQSNGFITRVEVEALLEVSASTSTRLLKYLVQRKKLVRYGKTKGVKYGLPDK